jgi:MSHA biogenesis protein MshN
MRVIERWVCFLVALGTLGQTSAAAENPVRGEYLASFGVELLPVSAAPGAAGKANAAPAGSKLNRNEATVPMEAGSIFTPAPIEEDNEVRTARARSQEELDLIQATDAVRLIEQGQYASAQTNLEGYLDSVPGAHQTRKTLATILMAQRNDAAAREVLESGLKLAPNFGPFKKLYARLLLNSEAERAVTLLEQVPPELTLDTEYHEIYAAALQMSAQFEAASLVYEALLQLDDRNARWWMGLAVSRDAVGDFEEAESAYAMASHFGARNLVLNQYSEARLNALRGQR